MKPIEQLLAETEATLGVSGRLTTPPGATTATADLARVDVPAYMARMWTVILSPLDWAAHPADQIRAFAEIRFGVASGEAMVEVDWRMGSRVAVFGSSVSVRAGIPSGLYVGLQGHPAVFRASIVPGSAGSALAPTRTVYYGTIGPASTTVLAVPRFARRVFVQKFSASPIDTWNLVWRRGDSTQVLQQGGFVANSASKPYLDPQLGIEVPPEATYLAINNTAAGNFTQTVAIYELGL